MNLAKEMKKKRDSEKRLEQNSPTTIFVEVGNGGEKSYNDYSNFATKKQLVDGLEEKAETDHNHKFIDLEDSPISYVGQAGKFPKVKATEDGLEFGEGGEGGELVQATETILGGIKAKEKTTESSEVAIDPVTGKLYVPSPNEATNGLPPGGAKDQILSKVDGTDYNAVWVDAPIGGGAKLQESRIGNLLPIVAASGLTAREANWQRFVCLSDCIISEISCSIFAVSGKIRLRIVEVNNLTGNCNILSIIHETLFQNIVVPSIVKFASLSISVLKDKLYAVIIESEIGTTLQMENLTTTNASSYGQGSLLPAPMVAGGYCLGNIIVGGTMTAYTNSVIPVIIKYD